MRRFPPLLLVAGTCVLAIFSACAQAQPTLAPDARTRPPSDAAAPALAPLSLDDAIGRVLQGNLDLAAVRREVDAAAALRLQAGRLPNPSLSYDVERVPGMPPASGVGLSVPLELGGRRQARIVAADRTTDVARAEVEARQAELRAAAIQAFFDVVAAQDREQLARGSLDLARRAVGVASRRVQAGRVSPVEETRARVAEASARVEISQAQTDLDNARERLAALFGKAAAPFGPVDGSVERLPEAPSEADLADRLAAAPELVRAPAEIERRDAAAGLARTQRLPTLVVNAGTRTLVENGQRAASLGVAVVVPIFDANQGNIREAAVRANQARQQLAAAEVRLRSDARAARQRLLGARREANLVRAEALPGATGALEATMRGYELGKFGFLDVLDAQRALFAARAQLLRAVADAYRAAAELERLLGRAASASPSNL